MTTPDDWSLAEGGPNGAAEGPPGGGAEAVRREAYRAAGVDVEAGERAVELFRPLVESTRRREVLGAFGGFAGAIALPSGYRDPVLVAATDGVGTKTALAAALGRYDTIGIDLVAMCVDDVACSGAAPLFFLDYLALGRLIPADAAALVAGIAAGCRQAGCVLLGGETAEHPGVMAPEAFDLAGFAVGVVERADLIDGATVTPGDAILGIRTLDLHANGYSLVRSVIGEYDLDLSEPYLARVGRSLGEAAARAVASLEPALSLLTLGEVLLRPTPIYSPALLRLREALRAAGHDLKAVAHITGGGLPGNVPRVLPPGTAARLDPSRWRTPSVMELIAALAGMDGVELRATFNGGLGMTLVVDPAAIAVARRSLAEAGFEALVVGEVVDLAATGGRRYVEAPLAAPWAGSGRR
jgi:phosphoribosylformylglycinamidine cyclo-ligase